MGVDEVVRRATGIVGRIKLSHGGVEIILRPVKAKIFQ